jgi:hypothetical protein
VDYLHKLCILVSATMCSLWTVYPIPSVIQSLSSLLCGLWHCLAWSDCKFTVCQFFEERCQSVMVGIYFFKKYGLSNFPHMCLLHTGLILLGCSWDLHRDFWNTSICCLALYSAIPCKSCLAQERCKFWVRKSVDYWFLKPPAVPPYCLSAGA